MVVCVCACRNIPKRMEVSQHTGKDTQIIIENEEDYKESRRCNICTYIKEIGPYNVTCGIAANEIVVRTFHLSKTESRMYNNRSLFLTVKYKDQLILDDVEIKSTSFKDLKYNDNAEELELSPTGLVRFECADDNLILYTDMYYPDTDIGYDLNVNISPTGKMILTSQENDLGFD